MSASPTKGDVTRARILRSAVELLSREGPTSFTASALAAEAGVSKATIFHHFDALDEIPLLALEEVFFAEMERVENDGHTLDDYLQGLTQLMDSLLEDKHFLRGYFVFLVKGIFDERLGVRLAETGMEMHHTLVASIAPRLPQGADPDVTARLMEVVMDGLALHDLILGDRETLQKAWELFLDGITRSLQGAESS